MKELLILSGKGGTGKTTIAASLAVFLSGKKILADADVDAANLGLVLEGNLREKEAFFSGWEPVKDQDKCTNCGICREKCRFEAVREDFSFDLVACEGCGVCAWFCPEEAITMKEKEIGSLCVSDTRYGLLVHAELYPGEENSGKLVSAVKQKAHEVAEQTQASLVLVDGSPGVGCPVIASLSGAKAVLIVAEPTVSGEHDLERLAALLKHFRIPGYLVVNKADLNPEITKKLLASDRLFNPLGEIPYDPDVFESLHAGKPLPEYSDGPAAKAIEKIAQKLEKILTKEV